MKILIKFNNDFIQFYDYNDYKIDELSRTNILDLNEIVLSDSFIDENYNFIFNYIKNKIIKDNISKVYLDKANINKLVFKLIYNITHLNYIYINEKKKIDIEIFKYILNNKNIKTIDCYDINEITFERLNLSRKVKILTRKKYCSDTYLYRLNDINTYSDMYYKKEITIDKLLQKKDLNILKELLKINKHLKVIYLKYFNKDNINDILNILKKYNKKHIRIEIIENDSNIKDILNNISLIKRKNKKIINRNKINLKIKYEDKYIRNNIFKELNLNLIKIVLISIILITTIIYTLFYFINEKKTKETEKTTQEINNIINSIQIEEPTNTTETKSQEEKIEVNSDIKTKKPKEKSAYFKNYTKAIKELKKINKDTVGWLTINSSTINYPVVQSTNNDKYLEYSFDEKKNPNGWIFMDYRNNPKDLDKNTVIYGHSGNYYVMFGSLYKVLNKNWYSNKNNQIITFNTENQNIKWQIFSIYTIDVTNDYMITKFTSDESYTNFLNKMKGRSKYNFNVNVTKDDKIITLSTCYKDSKHRLVIHAKMIK